MISVITPHYEGTNPFIEETYRSLLKQTEEDWEWVVVLNNGGILPQHILRDPKVRPVLFEGDPEKMTVGQLKRVACENAVGDILLELDADDMLTPDALGEVQRAFDESPEASFVYSNSAQFQHGTWEASTYSEYWGWRSREFKYEGHKLIETVAFPATPASMRMIYWAPNHVRAWRAEDYWLIGGHNESLQLADDYDLCCRFYLHGKMKWIDKCLYLYRKHDANTCVVKNADVQSNAWAVYSKYIFPIVEKWAREEGLKLIDLGAAHGKPDGYIGIDLEKTDIVANLEGGIPLEDDSCGIVRAYDVLEHLSDSVAIMNEIYRVLAPGGWLFLSVPSTEGRGAFQDPTHVSFWNSNSIWYYTNPQYAAFVPRIKCKFQVARVIDWFPSEFHRQHNILYLDAQLIALKAPYHPVGETLWGRE